MAAAAAGLGLWSCSADNLGVSEPDNGPALGETVRLTVTASRDASAATRTALTENDGNLDCVWSENNGSVVERILVTDANGVRKGVLALAEGAGTLRGTFTGTLTGVTAGENGKVRLNFLYLGTALNDKVSADQPFNYWNSDNTYSAYYASQPGTLASLTNQDLLTASKEVTLISGEGEESSVYVENLEMNRRISFAKFRLNMPEGVVLGENTKITVSGEAVNTCAKVSFVPDATTDEGYIVTTYDKSVLATKGFVTGGSGAVGSGDDDPDVTGSSSTSTSGTLPFSSSGVTVPMLSDGSLYMVLLPNATAKGKELTFSVTADDEKTYTGTFTISNEKGIEEGKYYHKAAPAEGGTSTDTDAIEINMSDPDAGNKPEQPEEPIVDTEVVGPEFEITDRNGKTVIVRFTRANLHYRPSDKSWYIPEKQTAVVSVAGRSTKYGATYNVEAIDLFRWGATGFKDERREVMSPETEVDKKGVTIGVNKLPYISIDGTSESTLNGNLSMRNPEHKYVDWGWCYGYQESGKKSYDFPDIYYTLQPSEWRTIMNKYVYVCATVDNVPGILMLDCTDDAEAKALLKKHGAISSDSDYVRANSSNISNKKTSFKWNNVIIKNYDTLKEMNAVFFPKAGSQLPGSSPSVDCVRYWETESKSSSNSDVGYNFFVRLRSDSSSFDFNPQDSQNPRKRACSVRLVKVVSSPDDDESTGSDLP